MCHLKIGFHCMHVDHAHFRIQCVIFSLIFLGFVFGVEIEFIRLTVSDILTNLDLPKIYI